MDENIIAKEPISEPIAEIKPDIKFDPHISAPRFPKYLLIVIFVLIAAGLGGFIFISSRPDESVSEAGIAEKSYVQKISEGVKTILPGTASQPSPAASPSPSTVRSSVEDILQSGGYQFREIDFNNNDGPSVEKDNLKFKITGLQSRFFFPPVMAAEAQPLLPIYLQNPDTSVLDKIAATLGIQAKPIRPESNKTYYLQYIDPEAKLIYEPAGGNLHYEAKPASGNLPTPVRAEEIARTLTKSLGFSVENDQVIVDNASISSQYENFSSIHPAIVVNFLRKQQDFPVVYSDADHFIGSSASSSLSPEISFYFTGGEKLTRLEYGSYAHHLGENPIMLNDRTLDQAVEELKAYGGHIRNIVALEDQRTYFACADNRCTVHDATITKAYKGWAWNTSISSLSYSEINDMLPRAFDYLMPIWIFEGTGLMDKAKTDETGKLIPNPDKTNNAEFYSQKVKFISSVPAFYKTESSSILRLKNYTAERSGEGKVKVKFETSYLFPTFSGAFFSGAEPRIGVKYKLLILFPDKTYSIVNGYKPEVYPGEITFDLGDAKGEVVVYLELPDFSNLIEKRTILVE